MLTGLQDGAVPCESSSWGRRLTQAVLQVAAKQKCTLLLRPSTHVDTDPCLCSVGQIKSPPRQQGAGKDTTSSRRNWDTQHSFKKDLDSWKVPELGTKAQSTT